MTAVATDSNQRHHQAWTGSATALSQGPASRIEALAKDEVLLQPPRANSTAANDEIGETTLGAGGNPTAATLFSIPRYEPIRTKPAAFVVEAEWEGSVVLVTDDHIVAALVGVKGGVAAQEVEAEIPWDEIADDDCSLVRLGALFRLSVGHEIEHGTRSRYSRLVFRRLPAWSRRDLEAALLPPPDMAVWSVWAVCVPLT